MGITPYVAWPPVAGGHRMTLFAWARPRRFPNLPPATLRYFDVAPGARVLAHCHWHARPREHPTLLLLHGLEGSSEAHYIRGTAEKGWTRGFNVVRLNQRNCGGTEHLSEGLYHSGLTQDPAFVVGELIDTDHLPAIAVAGFSLGGNLALKFAGEMGDAPPPALRSVTAICPTLDLATCVAALERPSNRLYEWNFIRNLKGRMRRKAAAWPGRYDLSALPGITTVREFDETYTAPHHGFANAADYYHRASALRVIDRITVPTLIITAEDDPFVPPEPFRSPHVSANAAVETVITPHGGHCAFIARRSPGFDGCWAEQAIVDFAAEHGQGVVRKG